MRSLSKDKGLLPVSLELRPSNIGGIGVFAVRRIPKGRQIADGVADEEFHNQIPWKEFRRFDAPTRKKIMDFCIGTNAGFIPPEDGFDKLSIEWYPNHSCDGNVGFNKKGNFVAICDICPGNELTYDYGLAESNPDFRMSCNCGSSRCRTTITGQDWLNEHFRNIHLPHMLPRLRKLSADTMQASAGCPSQAQ